MTSLLILLVVVAMGQDAAGAEYPSYLTITTSSSLVRPSLSGRYIPHSTHNGRPVWVNPRGLTQYYPFSTNSSLWLLSPRPSSSIPETGWRVSSDSGDSVSPGAWWVTESSLRMGGGSTSCLKGWDFTVAMTENKFNEALQRVVSRELSPHTLPTYEDRKNEVNSPELVQNNIVSLEGFKISALKLTAVEGEEQTGELDVTFSAGEIKVQKELVYNIPGLTRPPTRIPTRDSYKMSGHTLVFKVKVTAFNVALENNGGDKYDLRLEILRDDAIVGPLVWDTGLVTYIGQMRFALSEKLRRELGAGSKFNLGSFNLPKRNENQPSLLKDLFPRNIRFTFTFAPNGRSIIAALGTASTSPPGEGAFTWRTQELVPYGSSVVSISGAKMMSTLKPMVASSLNIGTSDLSVNGCKEITLNRRKNDFRGTTDLKSLTMRMYLTNELETKMHMFDHVSDGITVDIYVTVRVRLTYNSITKGFDVVESYSDHSTDYHREWWVVLLEVLSLGIGRLVTLIIEEIADGEVSKAISGALNFDSNNGGLPLNVGGVMGDVVDHLVVGTPQFYGNNFIFPLGINW